MSDLINRQDVINALNKKRIETMKKGQDVNLIWECLDVVAQVQPEQSIAKWQKDFREYINMLNIPRDDYNGIMEYINELPSANQWISCSEMLPNDDGNYIVTLSYTEGFKFSFVDIDNFSVYEHRWDVYGSEVVAWMPIPQPWRGDSNEHKNLC